MHYVIRFEVADFCPAGQNAQQSSHPNRFGMKEVRTCRASDLVGVVGIKQLLKCLHHGSVRRAKFDEHLLGRSRPAPDVFRGLLRRQGQAQDRGGDDNRENMMWPLRQVARSKGAV